MLFVVFTLDHPAFREALSATPGMTLRWEQSDATERNTLRTVVWADGEEYDAFEAALADDPTVEPPEQVIEMGEDRLYHVEVSSMEYRPSVYSKLVDEGCAIERVTGTHQGWEFHVTFPSHEVFADYREYCAHNDIGMEVHRLFPRGHSDLDEEWGLTGPQQAVLVTALENGYFDIPRDASLADVADDIGISDNAASERLRRGMRSLVRNTVATGTEEG